MTSIYVGIVLSKATPRLDRIYHYSVPKDLQEKIKIGSQVEMPFGKRKAIGYVVCFVDKPEVPNVRDVISVRGDKLFFTERSVELARWISEHYSAFFINSLRLMMPADSKASEKRKVSSTQYPVAGEAGNLLATGYRLPATFKLTLAQQTAYDSVKNAIDNNCAQTFLLYGVTGSGKTEVYIQLIDYLIKNKNKSAIVLVPEVSMTPDVVARFSGRFSDQIAVLHSSMTIKERRETWEEIISGKIKIVLGTRMAIFAPLPDLGLIVIDEEYETTYKSEQSPRYHAREVAEFLSKQNNVPLVLGSATPSVETYFKAQKGEYKLLTLPKRIDDKPLPPIEIIDLREKGKKGASMILSKTLRAELRKTIEANQQAILFLNRRGFFTYVGCKECGKKILCPNCSTSLIFHQKDNKLHCSHCGFLSEAPIICPNCQSASIRYFGLGTQRVEREAAEVCPKARILRVDADVTSERGKHEAIFGTFASGKADILIGTQLVTKGLDVANVTLIGIVSADSSLNMPDFRAPEHTFQELTQVAGRAGRHHLPGKVIIQTYDPEHYVIQAAAKHDYEGFYNEEIKKREELNYPPFSKLINIVVSAKSDSQAKQAAEKFAKELDLKLKGAEKVDVLGPAAAAIAKIRGAFRYQILIKCDKLDKVRSVIREAASKIYPAVVKLTVDVEPISML